MKPVYNRDGVLSKEYFIGDDGKAYVLLGELPYGYSDTPTMYNTFGNPEPGPLMFPSKEQAAEWVRRFSSRGRPEIAELYDGAVLSRLSAGVSYTKADAVDRRVQ